METKPEDKECWTLQVDGSSTRKLGGIGLLLESPKGAKLEYAITLNFKVTENEAEYEALITSLRISRSLQVKRIKAYTDSQLVESQFSGSFATKGPNMIKYLELLRKEVEHFKEFTLERFNREWNEKADALSKYASTLGTLDTRSIILMTLTDSSLVNPTRQVFVLGTERNWMTDIFCYLKDGSLPSDPREARRILCRANRYFILGEDLYKRSFTSTHLRCLRPHEAKTVLEEVHVGSCGSHSGGRTLAQKVIR